MDKYEIADWVWSFRLLLLALVALAAAWTGALLLWPAAVDNSGHGPSSDAKYEVTVEIFSSGTPIRTAAEISDIVGTKLHSEAVDRVSAQAVSPVVLLAASETDASLALEKIKDIEDQLSFEVQAQAGMLASWLDAATEPRESVSIQYLRDLAFLEGTKSGLIELLTPSMSEVGSVSAPIEVTASIRSHTGKLILPWAVAAGAFLLIAGTLTFVAGWRRHRKTAARLKA